MLMSSSIPKEQQSAFQRWEMTSFNEHHSTQINNTNSNGEINSLEMQAIKDQAYQEAYASGYKEAYEIGHKEGRQAGLEETKIELNVAITQFMSVLTSFNEDIQKAQQTIGQDLIDLAIDLAQKMTTTRFEMEPEIITSIISEAIASIPSIHQPAQLFLHPNDALIVQQFIGELLNPEVWKIQIDPHLERGGCRIETAQNIVDATRTTRWQRLTESISKATTPLDKI